MKSESGKKNVQINFSKWTIEEKESWKKEMVKEKAEEYNRLLAYCHELEGKVESLQGSKPKLNLTADQSPDTGKVLHQEISFIEDNKTIIFLVLNILFIIFTTYFFFKHPEKDIFPQENTIKKDSIRSVSDSLQTDVIPAADTLKN
jgi:hypothetical protein